MNTSHGQVRLMSDYMAVWPVWGSQLGELTPELGADLIAWNQIFLDSYHFETEWSSEAAEAQYAYEAPDLRDRLAHELGVTVVLDPWPVTDEILVEWLGRRL